MDEVVSTDRFDLLVDSYLVQMESRVEIDLPLIPWMQDALEVAIQTWDES